MKLTPHNCQLVGHRLDHPESVCLGPDGSLYAGSESGVIHRLLPTGEQQVIGSTGGFILGIALDGAGSIHACDVEHRALVQVSPFWQNSTRSTGAGGRDFVNPNHGVFDARGNLYVSDSGDYWNQTLGTGFIAVVRPDNRSEMFHEGPFLFANGMAIHPSGEWLYVAQSTASNIVRVPLDRTNGPVEVTHSLPPGTIPDGIAFAADGTLIVACYKPDAVLVGHPDGTVATLFEDPTGELLNRPTNIALGDHKLFIANLGGQHLTVLETEMKPGPIYLPML